MALIDIPKQFDNIKKAATSAIEEVFPIKKRKHELILERVWVEDKADQSDFAQQLKTKDREGTWGATVYASLILKDNASGKIIDRQSKITLFTLPKITPRASYIVRGNEYQVANQLRLKSGAYVKTMKNGGFKTQFNLARGSGAELHFNDKDIIIMKVGKHNIPLRPLLQGMGITDERMKAKWGAKVFENQMSYQRVSKENALKKFHQAILKTKAPDSIETTKDAIKTFIKDKTEILPEMTKLTLGKGFTTFNPELWLESSTKLVSVQRGEQEPDDVDSLTFKEFYGVDDSIKERIEKNKKSIAYKVGRNLDRRDKIKNIITSNTIGKVVESFFLDDDRASTPEQHNPLHMLSGNDRVTYLGPGSISNTQVVTPEMRTVHPTHFGFIDPVNTPESDKIGLSLNLAMGTSKKGNTLESGFYDVKAKRYVTINSLKAYDKKVAYPDQWDPKTRLLKSGKIKVMYRGKLQHVNASEVDYILPFAQNVFSVSTNLIPFMANDNGNRTMMAGKHMEQAISLKYREAPFVQNRLATSSKTLEGVLGEGDALYATHDGTKKGRAISGVIQSVTPAQIIIKDGRNVHKINKYKDFTLNQKTYITHDLTVKTGDRVTGGQLIADTNFTRGGTLALGTNIKTAYIPYKGYNFEDGIVISESGAKKLTSEHIHKVILRLQDSIELNLPKFVSFFPNEIAPKNLAKLSREGLIEVGSIVEPGDVVIAALRRTSNLSQSDLVKAKFHKSLTRNAKPVIEKWKDDIRGKVIKIKRNASQITILVRTEEQARIGDKLAGRHGNKGIVTKIIADNLAPKTADGVAVDMLLNPHGIISRINIGQVYESALGKVAAKQGGIAKIRNFTGENYLETVKNVMKKAGMSDKEELFDPESGKSLGQVHVGNPYVLKLNKQSEVNFSVRGENGSVSASTRQPSKGGSEGSKALDQLSMYSLLSHGARANLKEMSALKSENNPEFWEALKYGRMLPAPKSPFVFEKLISKMRGLGIDIEKKGSQLQLSPLTDKQTLAQSSMEITKPQFILKQDGKATLTKGGFLDLSKLGGLEGDKWGHLALQETNVNPIFEQAVKSLTKLNKKSYARLMNGTDTIKSAEGKQLIGGEAIKHLLGKIDIKKELVQEEKNLRTSSRTKRDQAIKRFRYLNVLNEKNISAADAYTRKFIPVVPPTFRPVSPMDDKSYAVDDINWMYRNIALIDQHMKAPAVALLAPSDLVDVRNDMNKQMRGLAGLDTITMSGRDKFGIITQIKGKGQPKEGFFQSKVLKKNQNLVGRGTIIPEPSLGIDEVALPKKMAWGLYSPFIIKELIKNGYSALDAKAEVKNKTQNAHNLLNNVMKNRPVMLNRAPSLHKFSMMAFTPKITSGKAIKIPPLVVSGFNADFNGDSASRHTLINVKYVSKSLAITEFCGTMEEIFIQITGKEISEMIEDAKGFTAIYEIPLGQVLTRGLVNGTIKETSIQRLTVHTSHGPCYKVSTNTGTSAIFSEHHNFSFINEDLELQMVKTEDMPLNTLVPKVNMEDAWKNVLEYQMTEIGDKPIIVSEDISYMLGFYAGDGHTCDRRKSGRGIEVGFTDTEGRLLDSMEKILGSIGFKCGKRQGTAEHPLCKSMFYNNTLGLWLIEHAGKGFDKKKVPTFIFNSPLSVRKAYFQGLLEAEGNICTDGNNKDLIRIEMNNDVFIRQLRILMNTCGIYSYLSETFHKDKTHKAWKLGLSKTSWDKIGEMPNGPKSDQVKAAITKRKDNKKLEREVYDIVPITEEVMSELLAIGRLLQTATKKVRAELVLWRKNNPGKKISLTDHVKNKKGVLRKYVSRPLAISCIHTYGMLIEEGTVLEKWVKIVKDYSTQWEIVESVSEVKREAVLFDFTVPEGETFSIDNGLITHNTMTVHVPITDKAVRESYKMMPSNNLWKPGTGTLMIGPSQESQLGFYLLSKTTEGRVKLNKVIPSRFKITKEINKGESRNLFMSLSKSMPKKEFGRLIDSIKKLGEDAAYMSGFSLGLEDLELLKGKDSYVAKLEQAAGLAMSGKASLDQLSNAFSKKGGIQDQIDKRIMNQLKNKNNSLYEMVNSGARGNQGQLRQIVASPLLVQDHKGRIIPSVIKKSFAEGLDLSDYWSASYGARKGMMDRALSTSEPGSFNKTIIATTVNNVVSMDDCGTRDGIFLNINSSDLLGRYIQGNQGGINDEDVIDALALKKLKNARLTNIFVRSPLKCVAPNGTCRHCFGIDENGTVVNIGDNLGVKAGQTISEPLTQLVMNTFHSGGIAGTGKKGGYERIQELFAKDITKGRGVLVAEAGTITRIEKSGLQGWNVYVDSIKYVTPPHQKLLVKQFDRVKKGDQLNEGPISPQELLKFKGLSSVQNYMTDELKQAYGDQGVHIDRKTFETIVKSVTGNTMVLNNIKDQPWLPGQTISYNMAEHYNNNRTEGQDKLEHEPLIKGFKNIPQSREDWLAQMGYTHIKDAIVRGASQGWSSDLKGYHPIPAYAFGATFGDGKDGRY